MNGKRIAELLEIHHNGCIKNKYLVDEELAELIKVITFIYNFNRECRFSPLTVYYYSLLCELESMRRIGKTNETRVGWYYFI